MSTENIKAFETDARTEANNQRDKIQKMLEKIPALEGKTVSFDTKIKKFQKIAEMYQYEKNSHPEFQEIAKALQLFTHVTNEMKILGTSLVTLPAQKNFSKVKTQFSQIDARMKGMIQTFSEGKVLGKVALGEIKSIQEAKQLTQKKILSQKELSLVVSEYTQDRKVIGSLTSSLEVLINRAAKVLSSPKEQQHISDMLKNTPVPQNVEAMKNVQRSVGTAWRSSLMDCIGRFGGSWTRDYGCFRIANGIVQRRHPGKSLNGNEPPVVLNNTKCTSEFATPNIPNLLRMKNVHPGAVIWVQSLPGCDPDSLGKNKVRNHWFTFSGYNPKGEPLFVDQGRERTIAGFGWCRNRFVHKIYQA